jgi:hypothetical protein
MSGESLEAVSCDLGVTVAQLSEWRDDALASAEAVLKAKPRDPRDDEIARLKKQAGRRHDGQRIPPGEDRAPGGAQVPFTRAEVEMMSETVSVSANRAYGLARVCRVWQVARSTIYHQRNLPADCQGRRLGPVGAATDAELAAEIRAVIEAAPSYGEATARSGRACASAACTPPNVASSG